MANPKQDKFSFPWALGQRLRAYSKAHGYNSNADTLRYLLDNADIRDILERNIKVLEAIDGSNNKGVSNGHQAETPDDTPPTTPGRLMPYGYYKGRPVLDLIREDPGYIGTLLSNASRYPLDQRFALTQEEQDLYDRIRQQKL